MKAINREKQFWPGKSMYFLTDSTYIHFPYFKTEDQKQIILNQFKNVQEILRVPITAYSIAINHYHLKFYLEREVDMAKIKQMLRGGISYEYKQKYKAQYNNIWQNRKIIRITSGEMDWKVTGYIIGNLLKHKEVGTFDELKQNKFSSFWFTAEKHGEDTARELVYGVIDVDEDARGDVDLQRLNKSKLSKL